MTDMPRTDFRSSVVDVVGRLYSVRDTTAHYGIEEVFGGVLEDKIADSTPLKDLDYANLFTYMHRRFGHPNLGSDPYKDLSAAWTLTTPEPDVFVLVLPTVNGNYFTFDVRTSNRPSARSPQPMPREEQLRIAGAYRDLLLDLLRPVCIRDSHINALGVIKDHALLEYDENDDNPLFEVRYAPSSGYPMPLGLVGSPSWEGLLQQALLLGSTIQEGIVEIVERGRKGIVADLANEPFAVQVLVARHSSSLRRGFKAIEADLATDVMEMAEAIQSVFRDNVRPTPEQLELLTDGAVDRAGKILAALAVNDDIRSYVREVRRKERMIAVFEEILVACDEDFPDEVFGKEFLYHEDDVGKLTDRMDMTRHARLAEAMTRLVAEDAESTMAVLRSIRQQCKALRESESEGSPVAP